MSLTRCANSLLMTTRSTIRSTNPKTRFTSWIYGTSEKTDSAYFLDKNTPAIDNGLFEQSQTGQGLQADFWGLKNLICFLLNKGSRSLAPLTPQTPKPKGKGGASNAPGLSCRAGTPTTTNNKPTRTAGGQRPEITIGKGLEGRKGGLTGERLALLSFHHDKFFYLVSCQ